MWSPDSRKLVAYRRKPGYTRSSPTFGPRRLGQLQPLTETRNYQKPGDLLDFNQPVLFDVDTGRQTIIDTSLFPNPYQISRPVWREDSRAFTFEYNQRGHQVYRVLEVDGNTGDVRAIISEEVPTFFAYRNATAGIRDTGHRLALRHGRRPGDPLDVPAGQLGPSLSLRRRHRPGEEPDDRG